MSYLQERLKQKIYGKEPKKKKIYRLPAESKKMAEKKILYFEKRNHYLAEHKFCECGCGRRSTEVHHMKGRDGELLYDEIFFMAVARVCHRKITNNPKWAMKKGFTISKLKKQNMKIILACFLLAMTAILFGQEQKNKTEKQDAKTQPAAPKEYCLSLPVEQWDNWLLRLSYITNSLKQSDIPSKTTSLMIDSVIAPFQNLILARIGNQVKAEQVASQTKPQQPATKPSQ